jgi:DNA-binding MarR family transcriptional regulator
MQLARDEDAARVVECLRYFVQQLRVSSHKAERELGVSGAQSFILRQIAAEPGCSIRRLSELTLTDASSASVVVSRLVSKGLIEREQDLVDSRRSVLSLTKRGRQLLAKAPEPYQMRLIAGLRRLPARQLRLLRVVLVKLLNEAGPLPGPAPLFFEEEVKRTRSVRVKSPKNS